MSLDQIREELLEGGLHEESVDRLLDHYQSMKARMEDGEYDEAGTHLGNFCENMVNILRDQMGEDVLDRPSLGNFVNNSLSGNVGTSEPDSIRLQIPRVLRAAYDIRNNRDSVHVNLRVPVNHADTQAGFAMCSWMLAELLRVYGDGDHSDDMEEVGELIDEISEPVTEGNPLEDLETSGDDFDRQAVTDRLEGTIQIADGDVRPGRDFNSLDTDGKIVMLLLGRRAAADLEHLENVGAQASWYSDFAGVTPARVRQIVGEFDFVQNGETDSGYQIPGYRVQEGLAYFQDD